MGDMADLPQSLARSIYRRRYWETPGFHRVAEIAAVVAEELFDTGVNMGPAVAVGFLQRALNALNRNGRDWADLAVDRSIGPATLGALRALLRVRGQAGACVLVRAMNALQGARYIERSEEHTSELQSLMRISYAVFFLQIKKVNKILYHTNA